MPEKAFRTDEFLFGVCWYPEQWPEEMWEEDLARMRGAGMNTVRVGESAWSVWEPEEGRYDFSLFDRAIDLAARHGFKIIVGTPTYAPPAWLTHRYPEVLRADVRGTPMRHGSRRHYNYTSTIYREFARRIVTAQVEHYRNHPAVIGWQIDNEFNCGMDVSFAQTDHAAFRDWLRKRYGTLEALNAAWGTVFWSQTYGDWEQIHLPQPTVTVQSPSLVLDFYRFTSDMTIEFCALQSEIIRRGAPHHFITHDGLFPNHDAHALTQSCLDFMSFNSYPAFQGVRADLPPHFRDRNQGLKLTQVRGISPKFIIFEQQAGPSGQIGNALAQTTRTDYLHPTPKPGQLRLWAWHSVAHGADGVLFFRWRTLPYGAEYFWHGLLDYGSQSHRRLQEVERFGAEVLNLADHVLSSRCVAHAGMVYDYDNESDAKVATVFTEARAVGDRSIYQVLSERHMLADLVPSQRLSDLQDIGRYPLLFHTNAQMLERAEVEPLRAYVEQGGTLVLGPRSGYRDRRSFCYMEPFPGVLRALVGAEIVDFTTIAPGEAPTMTFDGEGRPVSAPGFNEILRPESADVQVLARYASGYYAGEAAVVARQVGRGRVVYCGAFFAPDNIAALLDVLGFDDPHADWANIPRDVEVVTRESTEGRFHIIMNFSGEPQPLHLLQDMVDLQSGARMSGPHVLEPYDVLVAVTPAGAAGSARRRPGDAPAKALAADVEGEKA